jgi:hypothetical protein
MINFARLPLATALELTLPQAIGQERAMWTLADHFVGVGFQPDVAALDA